MAISKQLYSNNAKTTLASSISPSDTVLQLIDGSRFPIPNQGEYFLVTIEAGNSIEVIQVTGRTGNTLTGCTRAQEGFIASSFPAGARIEMRITKGTLENFARKVDRVDEVVSVDSLDTAPNSNSNSYITGTKDTSGNPVLAFKNGNLWRFNTHRIVQVTGAVSSAPDGLRITSTSIGTNVYSVTPGKYIIQFITGNNAGLARALTSSGTNTVTWANALPNIPSAGDQFEIYKSDATIITDLIASSDDGLIYSILLSD